MLDVAPFPLSIIAVALFPQPEISSPTLSNRSSFPYRRIMCGPSIGKAHSKTTPDEWTLHRDGNGMPPVREYGRCRGCSRIARAVLAQKKLGHRGIRDEWNSRIIRKFSEDMTREFWRLTEDTPALNRSIIT